VENFPCPALINYVHGLRERRHNMCDHRNSWRLAQIDHGTQRELVRAIKIRWPHAGQRMIIVHDPSAGILKRGFKPGQGVGELQVNALGERQGTYYLLPQRYFQSVIQPPPYREIESTLANVRINTGKGCSV